MLQYLYARKNDGVDLLRTVDSFTELRSLTKEVTSKVKVLELTLDKNEQDLDIKLERFSNLETLHISNMDNLELFLSLNASDSLLKLKVFIRRDVKVIMTLGFENFSRLTEFSLDMPSTDLIINSAFTSHNNSVTNLSIYGASSIEGLYYLNYLSKLQYLHIVDCGISNSELSCVFAKEREVLNKLIELHISNVANIPVACVDFTKISVSAPYLRKLYLSGIGIQNTKRFFDNAYLLEDIELIKCVLEKEINLSQHFRLKNIRAYRCKGLDKIILDWRNNTEIKEPIVSDEVSVKGLSPACRNH